MTTPFLCQTRADLMTEENVAALRRAGCAEAWMGVESGSQTVLDAMDKGITVAHVRGAVARLRAAGIRVGFFLQFGYPEEGWSDIEMTRQLIRGARPRRNWDLRQLSPARNSFPRAGAGAARGKA